MASRLNRRPVRVGNSGSRGRLPSFVKPRGQHRLGCLGERDGPLLASLSLAADMHAGAELGVTAVEPDKLGDREARLYGEDEECPVAQFSKDAGSMRRSSTRPDRRELV